MADENEIAWQSRNPNYPLKMYTVYTYLDFPGIIDRVPYPLTEVFTDIGDINTKIRPILQLLQEENGISVKNQVIITEMSLSACVVLSREFWDSPEYEISALDKLKANINYLVNYQMYLMLVVPTYFDGKQEKHAIAYPFLLSDINRNLRNFMMYSKCPVDRTAKCAALYQTERLYKYDLEKNEFTSQKDESESEPYVN